MTVGSPGGSTARAGAALAAAVCLLAALTACGSKDDSDDDADDVLPDHATLLLSPGDEGDQGAVTQQGTAPVTISWAQIDGGQATTVSGPRGTRAWDMPAFTTDADDYPRTAIVVRNAGTTDPFAPGTEDFTWGADFQLDQDSVAPTGPDNGDNLIQRGLWGQSAEYKAEVDLRRASCAVHGDQGTLLVRARMDAEAGHWYRMRCYRGPEGLTVTVRELEGDDWGPEITAHVEGPVGALEYPATMPIAIGGKVAPNGEMIRSATDQFNGRIANPVIEIGSS